MAALVGGSEKNQLVGEWECGEKRAVFEACGECEINSERFVYRSGGKDCILVFGGGKCIKYGYRLFSGGDTVLFNGDIYKRTQSGVERSIIEFLL